MVERALEERLKSEIMMRLDTLVPTKVSFVFWDEWVTFLRIDPNERGVSTPEFLSLLDPIREICAAHGVEFKPEHATWTSGPERWGFYYNNKNKKG